MLSLLSSIDNEKNYVYINLTKKMRHNLAAQLDNIIFAIIVAVVFLTPILFTPLTTEYFETPKIIVLSLAVLLLLISWSIKWIIQGKVTITRTPLDIPMLLLLIVILFSTFFSESKYVSIYGNFPRIHGSAITWTGYILFYFIAASNIRGFVKVRTLLYALLVSSALTAVVTILSYFNIYLPLSFAKIPNFTPTGSSFSTVALLALQIPLLTYFTVNNKRQSSQHEEHFGWFMPQVLALVILILFSLTIALVADNTTKLISLIGPALVLLISKRSEVSRSVRLLFIPAILCLVVIAASYIPTGKISNPLMQKRVDFQNLYSEVKLPFSTSWKISASSFRDAPFLGTGPATYLFNFTEYKPAEYNLTKYWNFRFDSAHDEFLQILGTLGGLGFLGLIFLSILIVTFAWKGLSSHDNNLTPALSISAILLVVIMTVHSATPVLIIVGFTILAMLMAIQRHVSGKVEELNLGIKASRVGDSNAVVGDFLPVILFIPIALFVAFGLWNLPKTVLADYNHRLALNAASSRGLETYNRLVSAEFFNPYIDLYRTDLAQTNFALANAIVSSKGPTEASPAGSLTDQDKQNIQQLLSQAIGEAQAATVLSPRSAQNFEILGSIYRNITGVAQNALQFSLDSYGKAIQRDPLNPLLRLNVGGIYYSIKNYDLAIRFFTDAANLKPDYANAYYNLSVALREKGDLQGAQQTAERVISLLQSNTNNPDYKVATEYLADLKARIATGSADQAGNVPPAAQENGALQKKDLPKVLDLKQPENISTPPAVKK